MYSQTDEAYVMLVNKTRAVPKTQILLKITVLRNPEEQLIKKEIGLHLYGII